MAIAPASQNTVMAVAPDFNRLPFSPGRTPGHLTCVFLRPYYSAVAFSRQRSEIEPTNGNGLILSDNRESSIEILCLLICGMIVVAVRGISSRASPPLGQPGSDSPLGCHSLPGQVRFPCFSVQWAWQNEKPQRTLRFGGGEGNRTPVRKSDCQVFSERSLRFNIPSPRRPQTGSRVQ